MMQERPPFSDWLEKLQQESWNLELLVSGFSIFLLIEARAGLEDAIRNIQLHTSFSNEMNGLFYVFGGILTLSCYALIVSLIIHIFARGFWIGMIGLRSVQSKIDFERLRYAPAFDRHLQERIPSLDRLLIRLDQVSSAIFSFAFLLIGMLFSIAAWFFSFTILVYVTNLTDEYSDSYLFIKVINYTLYGISILYILISLIYMIDTFWIGIFKRIRLTSKVYRFFYRCMVLVSLSFLYRPIYYYLVSYIGIWRSRILLHLFIFTMLLIPFVGFDQEIYYPDNKTNNKAYAYRYDDMRKADDIIYDIAIQSSIIEGNSLSLFIRYSAAFNNTLNHICAYTPSKEAGIIHGFEYDNGNITINTPEKEEASPDSLLQCLSELYEVYINDSLQSDQTYTYLSHPNHGEKGIYTVLDVSTVPVGYNVLRVDKKIWKSSTDTLITSTWTTVPFWKE